jgi:hypothetical protein
MDAKRALLAEGYSNAFLAPGAPADSLPVFSRLALDPITDRVVREECMMSRAVFEAMEPAALATMRRTYEQGAAKPRFFDDAAQFKAFVAALASRRSSGSKPPCLSVLVELGFGRVCVVARNEPEADACVECMIKMYGGGPPVAITAHGAPLSVDAACILVPSGRRLFNCGFGGSNHRESEAVVALALAPAFAPALASGALPLALAHPAVGRAPQAPSFGGLLPNKTAENLAASQAELTRLRATLGRPIGAMEETSMEQAIRRQQIISASGGASRDAVELQGIMMRAINSEGVDYLTALAPSPLAAFREDGTIKFKAPYMTKSEAESRLFPKLSEAPCLVGAIQIAILSEFLMQVWPPYLKLKDGEKESFMDGDNFEGRKGSALEPTWNNDSRQRLLALFRKTVVPAFSTRLGSALLPRAAETDPRMQLHVLVWTYRWIVEQFFALMQQVEVAFRRSSADKDTSLLCTQLFERKIIALIVERDTIKLQGWNLDGEMLLVLGEAQAILAVKKRKSAAAPSPAAASAASSSAAAAIGAAGGGPSAPAAPDGRLLKKSRISPGAAGSVAAAVSATSVAVQGAEDALRAVKHPRLNTAWRKAKVANPSLNNFKDFKKTPEGIAALKADREATAAAGGQ